MSAVRTQSALGRALRRARRLEAENVLLRDDGGPGLAGESTAIRGLLQAIQRAASADAGVLILGERGTETAAVARAIHDASTRASGPFITFRPDGLDDEAIGGRLFADWQDREDTASPGTVGCFELADGGTLFLGELGALPARVQTAIVAVMETGRLTRARDARARQLDVRIVAALTGQPGGGSTGATERIPDGRWRRLTPIEVHIPALRDRRADLPLLAAQLLQRHAGRATTPLAGFDSGALQRLLDHAWPGNLHELDRTIERAAWRAAGPLIRAEDLGLQIRREGAVRLEDLSLDQVESLLIRKAVGRFDGNVTRAARALGLSRSALYRRLQRHGL